MTSETGHRLDPQGKRALFEAPVSAARPEVLRPGRAKEGREALFSAGGATPGTVTIDCEHCAVRSRVSLADVGVRLLTGSFWLPARSHAHWMRCPSCGRRSWCRINWGR